MAYSTRSLPGRPPHATTAQRKTKRIVSRAAISHCWPSFHRLTIHSPMATHDDQIGRVSVYQNDRSVTHRTKPRVPWLGYEPQRLAKVQESPDEHLRAWGRNGPRPPRSSQRARSRAYHGRFSPTWVKDVCILPAAARSQGSKHDHTEVGQSPSGLASATREEPLLMPEGTRKLRPPRCPPTHPHQIRRPDHPQQHGRSLRR